MHGYIGTECILQTEVNGAVITCHLCIVRTISKEIMKGIRLWSQFLKNRTDENKIKYSKQRNYCISLLRKTRTQYYSNLDEKSVTDKKMFWETVKLFLSHKIISKEKIALIAENEIVSNDEYLSNYLQCLKKGIRNKFRIPFFKHCR